MKKKSKGVSLLMAAALVTTGAVLLTPDAHDDYDYDGLFDVGTKVAVGLDGSIYVAGTGAYDAGDQTKQKYWFDCSDLAISTNRYTM